MMKIKDEKELNYEKLRKSFLLELNARVKRPSDVAELTKIMDEIMKAYKDAFLWVELDDIVRSNFSQPLKVYDFEGIAEDVIMRRAELKEML